jgi:protein TonB
MSEESKRSPVIFSKPGRAGSVSFCVHAIAILVALGWMHHSPHVEPSRLPGSHNGVQFLTYYSPGSIRAAANSVHSKVTEKPVATLAVKPAVAPLQTDTLSTLESKQGDSTAGQSGLGDGNITIAMQKYFPYPKPSLSTLPTGTAGDVILKAVIDEHGKITQLTLLAGLGPAIDDEVIQTVDQWVYTPAMKDGVPVPSVEELHFHYERRG